MRMRNRKRGFRIEMAAVEVSVAPELIVLPEEAPR